MEKQIVRPAQPADVQILADVKLRHVRALYRGMLSASYLKSLNEATYLPQLQQWLETGEQVDVLEKNGEAVAFIAYGEDPADNGCGLIHEAGMLPVCTLADAELLVCSCKQHLAERYPVVRVMTPKDNFRTRFLYEQQGFRPDGYQTTVIVDGSELRLMRMIGGTCK